MPMKTRLAALTAGTLAAIMLAPTASADPDDDLAPPNEICTAFDLGIAPGDIPGLLGANDKRWNYWRAQQRTSQTIVGGDCG